MKCKHFNFLEIPSRVESRAAVRLVKPQKSFSPWAILWCPDCGAIQHGRLIKRKNAQANDMERVIRVCDKQRSAKKEKK